MSLRPMIKPNSLSPKRSWRLILLGLAVALFTVSQVSSGINTAQAVVVVNIQPGDSWNFFRGVSEPPATWADIGFDDSLWETGPSGFGYGDGDDATLLSDMLNSYTSAYVRTTFNLASAASITDLDLTVVFDDGYVAYLNGVEVARNNVVGTPPAFNATAIAITEPSSDVLDISSFIFALVDGENVLALQGHNQALSSSDFSLIPSLVASDDPAAPPAPSALTIVDTRDTEIDISWTDNSSNETGFGIQVSTSGAGGPFVPLTTVAIDETTFTATGLALATQYCYQVNALGASGDSAFTAAECGLTTGTVTNFLPVTEGQNWRYFKGTVEPTVGWNTVGFDDSTWITGPSGFGYGDDDDATILSDMQNSYRSLYIRRDFSVPSLGDVATLTLTVDFDDGYVAYLNGVEVARNNVIGTPPAFNTTANGNHEASGSSNGPQPPDVINISSFTGVLNEAPGSNVLAIQGHNQTLSSSDFSLIPSLVASSATPPPAAPTGLTVDATRDTEIDISWTDNSADETGFGIQVSTTGAGGPFSPLTTVAIDETTFTATGLALGTEYCYQVNALGAAGDSTFTTAVCGLTTGTVTNFLPITEGQTWRYFKGAVEPTVGWNTVGFDDSTWLTGPSGFGYGDGDDTTILADMRNSYWSVYARREFSVPSLAAVVNLSLNVVFDDGYVAYLNGVEVARNNVTGTPPVFNTPADSVVEPTADAVDISSFINLLNEAPGSNVLAVQGHNQTLDSSDFSLTPTLGAGGVSSGLVRGPYLQNPSEGSMTIVFATSGAGVPSIDYAPVLGWTALGFDDSAWLTGPSGFGYGDGDDATVLNDMQNGYVSVLARTEFNVVDVAAVSALTLTMDFDDGFVAYLNGVEVARDNIPGVGLTETTAGSQREASGGASGPEDPLVFDLSVFIDLLVDGTNVLAVSGHNEAVTSSDFSLIPVLDISAPAPTTVIPAGAVWSYFKGLSEPGVGAALQTVGASFSYPELGGHFQHEVVLTGLTPDASYEYQLFLDGAPFSDPFEFAFRASPADGSETPFDFVVIGDTNGLSPDGNDLADQLRAESYDLTLTTGDNAYENGTWEEFQTTFFEPFEGLWSAAPIAPSTGNHDLATEGGLPVREAFVLPTNAPPGNEEEFYSFDYGNVHFIALDTQAINTTQTAWLAADLAATTQPLIIAYFHRHVFGEGSVHPIDESSAPGAGSPQIRQNFAPLFEQYGVALVLNGHNHMYGRSAPIKNASALAPYGQATTIEDGGVIYVTTGGGGRSNYTAYTDSFHNQPDGETFTAAHYTRVTVTGCRIDLVAIDTNDVVRDTFTIDDACVLGGGSSGVTLTAQVSASADDAYDEPTPNAFPGFSSTDTIVFAGAPGAAGPVYGGWRWTGLSVPTNAVISEAYVEISQSGFGIETTTTLAFEDVASPLEFDGASTPADRWASRTTFEIPWTPDLLIPDTFIRSPNIADGIRELLETHGVLNEIVLLESGEGVTQGQFHQWRSWDGDNTRGARLVIKFAEDVEPPTDPTLLAAVPVRHNQADLNWIKSTDDVGIDFYRIYRDGVPVTISPTNSFSNIGLAAETTYVYQVSAVDLAGKESGLSNTAEITTGPAPITGQVSTSSDDAHEDLDSWPGYDHSAGSIFIGRPGANDPVTGGFRFANLGVPANAIVTDAYVELTQSGYGFLIETNLSLELSAAPLTFSGASGPANRTSTAFSTDWTWPGAAPGTVIQTPSLTVGIQELIDTYGALDSIVLIEKGLLTSPLGQYHTWSSFDGDPLEAARIHIEYIKGPDLLAPVISDGTPTGVLAPGTTSVLLSVVTDEDATCRRDSDAGTAFALMADLFTVTGTTFHSMTINGLTDGVTSTNYIRCEDPSGNATTADYEVSFMIAVPDFVPPVVSNPLPAGGLPFGTTQTLVSVDTDETTTCKISTVSGQDYDTMTTLFTTTGGLAHSTLATGLVDETSYNFYVLCRDLSGNDSSPETVVSFSVLPAPLIINGQVGSSTDDAYHDTDSWPAYSSTDGSIYAGRPGSGNAVVGGFRFAGLAIPENAIITDAYVELTQSGYGFLIETNLSLELSASPATFSPGSSPADRASTAFSVDWTWPGTGPGAVIQTPSLAAGIQELISTFGDLDSIVLLESGLLTEPLGQTHTWTSFDGNPVDAARIHIEYSLGADTKAPVVSAGAPSGVLAPGTTSVLMSVATNEDATCRTDTTPGTDFALMADLFTVTGTTLHTITVSGLTDGATSTHYVRCEDGFSNTNLIDYVVSFSVAVPDLVSPVVSNPLPTGVLLSGTTQTLVSVDTDETATCKISTVSGQNYDTMPTLFTSTGGLAHSTLVTGLVDDTSYTFYVLCRDLSANDSSPETLVSFNVLSAPLIVSVQLSLSSDDAHEDPDGWPGYQDTAGSIYAGRPGSGDPVVGGFRFTGLSLPANAIVTNAYVELTQVGWGYLIETELSLEASASPLTFNSGNGPATRASTAFTLNWIWPGSAPGSVIQTPSIAAGIQELVDTFGAIDSVVLLEAGLLTSTDGQSHTWSSFDGNPADAATIFVEYVLG